MIRASIKVHSFLGPGLLESAYEACLTHELRAQGHVVETQVPVQIMYGSVRLDVGYRIDLIIDNCVLVEVKACATLLPIHNAQVLSYLKHKQLRVALLINFNVVRLKDGIRRIVT